MRPILRRLGHRGVLLLGLGLAWILNGVGEVTTNTLISRLTQKHIQQ